MAYKYDGFTLFPTATITADTNTRDFDCRHIDGFYLVMVLGTMGASQTVRPILQFRLPDGTTYIDIDTPTNFQTAAGTYTYFFGSPDQAANNDATELTEAHPVALARFCRIKLDVTNANNCPITLHLIPA